MKKLLIYLLLATGLMAAPDDLILSQAKNPGPGNIQRNVAPVASGFLTFDASKVPTSPAGLTWVTPVLGVPDAFSITSAGSIDLTAGGTNENITLTPSGTGTVKTQVLETPTSGNMVLRVLDGDALDIQTQTYKSGANTAGSPNRTNSADKRLAFSYVHYLTAEEDILLFRGESTSGANNIIYGGGSSIYNTATAHTFYTAANNTTTTGTNTFSIQNTVVTSQVNLQVNGAIIGATQALSGAGAVNITQPHTDYTSTGGAQALTLANGTVGQTKTIVHVVDGGSGVLTPTTKVGYTTITFTNAGDSVTLRYTATGWAIVGIFGAVAA